MSGEHTDVVAELGGTRIEHILSGVDVRSDLYVQDEDEWVVVIAGSATLEVDGDRCDLGVGDWALLPAGTPHRVLRTERGTSWLAVHAPPRAP